MSDDRWQRIKALFQNAVEQPPTERGAFLASATGGDEELRREVESLLAADADGPGFWDRLPVASGIGVAGSRADAPQVHHTLSPRELVGPYEVVALLGAGTMGEVYRAHDTKLNRDVALKVLPGAFTLDPDRLSRFKREAQVLAALNHPNVAAIYGLEDARHVQAIVLELVDGTTLEDRIARGPLLLDDVLQISRQIADALEAAHDKGIVHRDLKPANIKITVDGVVKVLDFGLAKSLSADAADSLLTQSPAITSAGAGGVIMGTAAYMSPEQARGKAIDKRTDIWAFGCVLYEMLTGHVPFPGETIHETFGKIFEREPDWSALPPATPAPIRRLLLSCFVKDPKQRLRDIGDGRIAIDAIIDVKAGPREGESAPPAQRRTRSNQMRWIAFTALAALAVVVGVWVTGRSAGPQVDPFADARFTRFTDWEGTEAGAQISPDGKFVAFVADKAGQFDIWVSQVGTGDFRNLTNGNTPGLQPAFVTFWQLGFSGDGAEIWFSPETGPSMAQMIIPLLGGTPRAFLDKSATAPSWSPDGTRLTYFKNVDGDPLFVADRTGADARQILMQKGMHHHNPVWSSDGQWIYFARGSDPTDEMDVWRVRPSGESLEPLTERSTAVNFMTPLDTRTLLYVARAKDRSGPWLWALDVEHKMARRVSSGLGQYLSASASQDGRRVVATVANPTVSLWRVPLLDHQAEDRDAQAYPLPAARALAPRFAGASLFYLSGHGTGDGLWRFQDGQASEISKAADGGLSEPPAVSRDGQRVAVIVRPAGKRQLSIVSADGRSSRMLAPSFDIEGAVNQGTADWSPDGNWIVTGGRDAQGPGLFKIPVDSGVPVRLVEGKADNPIWSPDGNLIVYAGKFFTGQVELLGVRPDGTPVPLPAVRTRPGGYRFLPDGTGLVYLPFIPSLDFWLIDFASETSRQLTHLSNQGTLGTFDITPDGKAIVFDRTRQNSDVVLIELAK